MMSKLKTDPSSSRRRAPRILLRRALKDCADFMGYVCLGLYDRHKVVVTSMLCFRIKFKRDTSLTTTSSA